MPSMYVATSLVARILFFKTLHLLYTKLQVLILKSVSDPCIVMQLADLSPFGFVFWPYFVNTHCLLFSNLAMLSQCQSLLCHSLKNVMHFQFQFCHSAKHWQMTKTSMVVCVYMSLCMVMCFIRFHVAVYSIATQHSTLSYLVILECASLTFIVILIQ